MAAKKKPTRKPERSRAARGKKAASPAQTSAAGQSDQIAKAPLAVGRPPKYRPEFCELVVRLGDRGKSRAQIARYLGVSRQTLHNWEAKHPDFVDAMAWAKDCELAYWEELGHNNMLTDKYDKQLNAPIYNRQMANRFRADHGDRVEYSGRIETQETGETSDTAARKILYALAVAMNAGGAPSPALH